MIIKVIMTTVTIDQVLALGRVTQPHSTTIRFDNYCLSQTYTKQ